MCHTKYGTIGISVYIRIRWVYYTSLLACDKTMCILILWSLKSMVSFLANELMINQYYYKFATRYLLRIPLPLLQAFTLSFISVSWAIFLLKITSMASWIQASISLKSCWGPIRVIRPGLTLRL